MHTWYWPIGSQTRSPGREYTHRLRTCLSCGFSKFYEPFLEYSYDLLWTHTHCKTESKVRVCYFCWYYLGGPHQQQHMLNNHCRPFCSLGPSPAQALSVAWRSTWSGPLLPKAGTCTMARRSQLSGQPLLQPPSHSTSPAFLTFMLQWV